MLILPKIPERASWTLVDLETARKAAEAKEAMAVFPDLSGEKRQTTNWLVTRTKCLLMITNVGGLSSTHTKARRKIREWFPAE